MLVRGEPDPIVKRTVARVDDLLWRAGAWLRLRDDPLARLVPAEFRRDGMYLNGRNGRMFLARDSSRLLDQHTGRLTMSAAQAAAWSEVLEKRVAVLARHGSQYAVLVPPNAHSVYPEDLPRDVHTAPVRPVHTLLAQVTEHGPRLPVVYPLPQLLERKRTAEVYPRTETHWNELGAFVAYEALLDSLPDSVPARRLEEDELWFIQLSGPGDLGIKKRLPAKSPHVFGYPRHPNARLVADNRVEGTGNVMVTECRTAPDSTCVLFGDSYAYGLLPFLAESFRRLVFAQTPGFDVALIARERPQLVVTVISERFLLTVPDDDLDVPTDVRAREKAEAGTLRPRIDRWDDKRHVSPAAVEWIRAEMLAEGRFEEATLISVLAYAGLRPAEAQMLRWGDIHPDVLRIPTRPPGSKAPLDEWPTRDIRLFAPLAQDLARWRAAGGRTLGADLVFPSPFGGGPWKTGEWRQWADERYLPFVLRLGLGAQGPGALRLTFIALAVHGGVSAPALAAELGDDPVGTEAEQGHRIAEAARAGHVPAAHEIERARRLVAAHGPGSEA